MKFGYIVESRSIIFSKLLEGLALSAAATGLGATEAVVARTASLAWSPLTAAVLPAGVALAVGTPVGAAAALKRGGSDGLAGGVLLSAAGWGWGWFCCCPGT